MRINREVAALTGLKLRSLKQLNLNWKHQIVDNVVVKNFPEENATTKSNIHTAVYANQFSIFSLIETIVEKEEYKQTFKSISGFYADLLSPLDFTPIPYDEERYFSTDIASQTINPSLQSKEVTEPILFAWERSSSQLPLAYALARRNFSGDKGQLLDKSRNDIFELANQSDMFSYNAYKENMNRIFSHYRYSLFPKFDPRIQLVNPSTFTAIACERININRENGLESLEFREMLTESMTANEKEVLKNKELNLSNYSPEHSLIQYDTSRVLELPRLEDEQYNPLFISMLSCNKPYNTSDLNFENIPPIKFSNNSLSLVKEQYEASTAKEQLNLSAALLNARFGHQASVFNNLLNLEHPSLT